MTLFTVETVFWAVLAVSVIHVIEEYAGGWVRFVNSRPNPIGHTTMGTFYLINSIFLVLCILAALLNVLFVVFSLSITALLFVNAMIHIGGTIRFRKYNPGVATAVLLYVPLSIYVFYLYYQAGLLGLTNLVLSALLGTGWMVLAVAYGIIARKRTRD